VSTAVQGSKGVRIEFMRRKYQVRARYQVRANPLLVAVVLIVPVRTHTGSRLLQHRAKIEQIR